MKLFLAIFAVFLSLGCRPSGEVTRVLHPPHQRYLDRLNPKLKLAPKDEPTTSLANGLPDGCEITPSPFCLTCKDESFVIKRCYDFKGAMDPSSDCRFSPDVVKCLVKKPPFALFLELKSSDEKEFHENLAMWTQTVHQIWDEKLSPSERAGTQKIVNALEILAFTLTNKAVVSEQDIQDFAGFLDMTAPDKLVLAKGFFNRMAAERTSGKLKLADAIEGMNELIKETHGSSPLLEKFGTMSLEGLED